MKIEFKKVLVTPKEFNIETENIKFSGEMFYEKNNNLVVLDSVLKGQVETQCDRCTDKFNMNIDENLKIKISNGIYNGTLEDDIFEVFNGKIDFNEILKSEIELIKSDYHICSNCKNVENFEIEY